MALAFRPHQPVTADELERLSREYPAMRFERSAQGELIVSPPTGLWGNFGEFELARQVGLWAEQNGTGRTASSAAGVTLPDSSIVSPDAAWFSHERLNAVPEKDRLGFPPVSPDVAFELLSPSDRLANLRAKADSYLRNGVRLVVLLEPRERLVECYRTGTSPERHPNAELVTLEPEMPGFMLNAKAVFEAMK